jgi:anti-anti-sigma factor
MNQRRETVEIQSERRQQAMVISLAGSFDALTAPQAERTIAARLEKGQQQVVVDLSQVDFMSSSGVRVLLIALKQSREVGSKLRLAAAQPGVQRTLEISGLVRVLKTYPTVEGALRSFEGNAP